MNPARIENPTQHVCATNPAVLAEIYEPDINLAIWQAGLSSAVRDYAQALSRKTPAPNLKITGCTADIIDELSTRLPQDSRRQHLLEHVRRCCEMFTDLFDAKDLGLRFETLDRAMCPRFHVDNLPVRLITTLHGVATEWLPEFAVDRQWLGRRGANQPDQTSGLIRDINAVAHMHAGDVALMKGESWEGNQGRGLVHRSPQPGPGASRLVLTLDWVS